VNKKQMLTAVHWTKIREHRLAENSNNGEFYAACCHAKCFGWKAMWVVR